MPTIRIAVFTAAGIVQEMEVDEEQFYEDIQYMKENPVVFISEQTKERVIEFLDHLGVAMTNFQKQIILALDKVYGPKPEIPEHILKEAFNQKDMYLSQGFPEPSKPRLPRYKPTWRDAYAHGKNRGRK